MIKLNEILTELVGQKFLFKRGTYPESFCFHFGDEINYTHPKMKHLKKGTIVLYTEASLCDGDAEGVITKAYAILTEVGITLALEFDSGKVIKIIPTEPDYPDVSDWCISFKNVYVEVGPKDKIIIGDPNE